jgi:hypothetical protein
MLSSLHIFLILFILAVSSTNVGLLNELSLITFVFSRLLVGKPEGKRPLGRPRRRWIDNIKMDLLERVEFYVLD